MKPIKYYKIIFVLLIILMLIFPNASLKGASNGLLLWFNKVLPSLLPFLIMSNILVKLDIAKNISKFTYPIFKKILPITPHGSYAIFMSFISGLPMGAKISKDLLTNNKIDIKEANFLLCLCNNLSPFFIINYIAITQLKLPHIQYHLLIIIYLSSIISSILYYYLSYNKNTKLYALELDTNFNNVSCPTSANFKIIDESIMDGFEIITKIGGYIMLFSILAEIISKFNFINYTSKIIMIGFIEITNGIHNIANSSLELNTKIVLSTIISSFGGLSAIAQTQSIINSTRLSMKSYFTVKLINIIVSYVLIKLYLKIILINII